MSQITASEVKALRDRTNQPMMDCKKALMETGGDMEKAVEFLRARNKGVVDKRADKEVAEGRVTAHIDSGNNVGVLVEVRCESAPVAKTEQFVDMCNDIAKQIALGAPASVDDLLKQKFVDDSSKTIADRIQDVIGLIREKMEVARFTRIEGTTGAYCHHDGSVGVILEVEGENADPQVLRDICMHITAIPSIAGTRDDVPADILEKERQIAIAQTREDPKMEGKPDEIIEKAAQGKLNKWLAQNVLLDQPFVKDESKTVGGLLKQSGLKFKRFIRYRVGASD